MIAWLLATAIAADPPEVPAVIAGTFVVQTVKLPVSDGHEDFARWMHREAMATGDDCYTVERTYDFGPAPKGEGPHRPPRVAVTETITCTKGGLGTYHASATLEVEAEWSGPGKNTLKMPGAKSTINLTRLRLPRDVGAPAQWAAEPVDWVLKPTEMVFVAHDGRHRDPVTLRGTVGNRVYGLAPRGEQRPNR